VLLLYVEPPSFPKQTVINGSSPRQYFNATLFQATVNLSSPIGGNLFWVGTQMESSSSCLVDDCNMMFQSDSQ